MTTIALPVRTAAARTTLALVGNPNAGKTTLFNALTGLRAKTANFPGTTIEHRVGRLAIDGTAVEVLDLPGLYSLAAATSEERIAREAIFGRIPGHAAPSGLILLLDATNLERNLYLASQALELGVPMVVALNMIDLAERQGLRIDADALASALGCPVVAVAARSGRGLDALRLVVGRLARGEIAPPAPAAELAARDAEGCPDHARYDWAESVGRRCISAPPTALGSRTDAIDRVLTHSVVGVIAFMAVMVAVFYMIFSLAAVPMTLIDAVFGSLGTWVAGALPAGPLRGLVVDGIIGGVGGVVVFLPQICILFFFIALLEDTGYLARAAFVMDRLMRRVGLPGKAFVPMLSAHACAVPAIMSTRVIDDRRDRLVTILVLPLLTCSARLPVYTMVAAMLFPGDPWRGALLFTGAYGLGIVAAISMALLFKRTILPGEGRPLVLELPSYKVPSLRTAALLTLDRARIFLRKAGTIILAISVVLWWLATYPTMKPADMPAAARQQIASLEQQATAAASSGDAATAESLRSASDNLKAEEQLAHSFAGRVGRAIEPVIRPLGFNWQIGVGILSSFAAREVLVSTLAVVYGAGEAADENGGTLLTALHRATRADGSPVFTTATCASLLVFFVLAMQCLATQVVTRRETGRWRWAAFQLAYMTALAYMAALGTYQVLRLAGVA